MLAAFVAEFIPQVEEVKYKVVSVATGTKSIGKSKMNEDGLVLNDLHAEVLARRSLIKTLYKEMNWL